MSITRDFINGAKARALREPWRPDATGEWKRGYHSMEERVSSFENQLQRAALGYKSAAEKYVRELEGIAREHGEPAGAAAEPECSGERPA
jgi:hypothetical protein